MAVRQRRNLLVVLIVAVAVLTATVLWTVLSTVFFAITIAYVLYPFRQLLVRRGINVRVAAIVSTLTAFLTGVLLMAPLLSALYFRRGEMFRFLRRLPAEISIPLGDVTYTIDVAGLIAQSRTTLEQLAVTIIQMLPPLMLKVFLFTLIVYALMLHPKKVRKGLLRPVPPRYQDIVLSFHQRTRSILYAIYVLQAAVAFGTFLIALVVFWLLGYQGAFVLAVLSGILQFIPIVGPSIVVALLGVVELVAGNVTDAAVVVVVGLVVIGFLPDALIRPRLARMTSDIPGSLYFVGFTGGILSVGLVGLIAGPVVVALLAEAVSLLSAESESIQEESITSSRLGDRPPPTP